MIFFQIPFDTQTLNIVAIFYFDRDTTAVSDRCAELREL